MACLALLAFPLFQPAIAASRPNILLIVADDVGFSDLGCYGGEINTPHLDSLAAEGLRFTNYYVNNMCWPTRASLLTGLYPETALPRKGSASGGLHPTVTSLPEALGGAGYTTLMSGKWHLSNAADPDGPNAPHHRGFDHFYGTIHGASDFFAPVDLQLDGKDMTHEWRGNPNYYYTDAITDHALSFLKDARSKQVPESPFFLYLAYTAAHWPLHAKPEDTAKYRDRYSMGWDELRNRRHTRMKAMGLVPSSWERSPRHPSVLAWSSEENKEWQERRMEVYAAQLTSMDENIGRVIQYLKDSGAFENTLILFQNDNGGCHVEYDTNRTGSWTRPLTTDGKNLPIQPGNIPGLMPGPQTTFQSYGYGWANASNTPFRLFKQHDHEGGTRSPLIVSWPRKIKAERGGDLVSSLSHAIDMMPSLVEAAEVVGFKQSTYPFEGRSFLSGILGTPSDKKDRPPIFWAHSKGKAVRKGQWKLVAVGKGEWELYNLEIDGTEMHNLADDLPDRVSELAALHADWAERTNLAR
ncbi:arylsulfatase [bacterium]|jgi:arylsulfatase A-like enzyme|nr:arylsulfatase [bacterium]